MSRFICRGLAFSVVSASAAFTTDLSAIADLAFAVLMVSLVLTSAANLLAA